MVNFQMVLIKINNKDNDDSSHLGCDATSTGSSNPFFLFFVIRARSICPRCTTAYRLIVRPLPPPLL